MADCKEYFQAARRYLAQAKESQRDNILKAADMIGTAMTAGGIVQLVGFGHDMEFSMELGYRAGGLMPFHRFAAQDLPMKGLISPEQYHAADFTSHLEYMKLLWDVYNVNDADLFLVACADGSHPFAVQVAKMAKESGHKVIAVVSAKQMAAAAPRHPSGFQLTAFADLVLDTGTDAPDTLIELTPGLKLCQAETLTGNVIAQMLTAEMYRWFVDKGLECPVLLSANVAGADAHNRAISDKYLGRWNA